MVRPGICTLKACHENSPGSRAQRVTLGKAPPGSSPVRANESVPDITFVKGSPRLKQEFSKFLLERLSLMALLLLHNALDGRVTR
jgi:hypothetical protein